VSTPDRDNDSTGHAGEVFTCHGLPRVHGERIIQPAMAVSKRSWDGKEPHLHIIVGASEPGVADGTAHEIELSTDDAHRLAKWLVHYLI
jgi:hypothetical protein